MRIYNKEWARKNPDKIERKKAYERELYNIEREKILEALGRVCKWCEFSDPRALQIDHVFGDGYIDKKNGSRGHNYRYYRRLMAEPNFLERYQLLCANCNQIKRVENNEHLKRSK